MFTISTVLVYLTFEIEPFDLIKKIFNLISSRFFKVPKMEQFTFEATFCSNNIWSFFYLVCEFTLQTEIKAGHWSMLRFFFMNIQSDHAIDVIFSSSLQTFIKIPFGLSVSIILISYISHGGGWVKKFKFWSPMSFTRTWKI